MRVKKDANKLFIDGNHITFDYRIDTLIEFEEFCVILLMSDDIPDNNVIAIWYDGTAVWNISEIIKLRYPEAYVSLRKESDTELSVISYNGVKFVVDVYKNEIVRREVTK